jgi:hypothetical protein
VAIESSADKTILNYFTALAVGDSQKAFDYLSRQGQRNEGGHQRYAARWRLIEELELTSLAPQAAGGEQAGPTSHIKLRLRVKGARTDPEFEGEVEALVALVEEPAGLGLLKIDSIVDRPELPFPPQLKP